MNSYSTKPEDIRKFGLMAFVFFGCLSLGMAWRIKVYFSIFFSVLSFLGVLMLLLPSRLQGLYKSWIWMGHFVGRCITILLLTLIFYLIITPYGIILRLLGKRMMPMLPDKNQESYWIARNVPFQDREQFFKRF